MSLMILAQLNGVQGEAIFQVVVALLLALILGFLLALYLRGKNSKLFVLIEEYDVFKKKIEVDQKAQDDRVKLIGETIVLIQSDLKSEKEINSLQDASIKQLLKSDEKEVDLSSFDRAIGELKTNQEENNRLFNDAAEVIKEIDREKDVIDSNGKGLLAEVLLLKSENKKLWDAIRNNQVIAVVEQKQDVEVVEDVVIDKETVALQNVAAKKHLINFSSIGLASESDKDDLKIIKGIGPFIEKKLNALDIWTFAQIASFTEEDVDSVTDAIEFFPGRIVRDNWVSQAGELK